MSFIRRNSLQAKKWRAVLLQTLGTDSYVFIPVVLLIVLSMAWFANSTYSLFITAPPTTWRMVVCLVSFPVTFIILVLLARKQLRKQAISVAEDAKPARVRGLIIFLSPMGPDKEFVKSIVDGTQQVDEQKSSYLQRFTGSWRMPLESILYHIDRLEYVVLIPSADHRKDDGDISPGTIRETQHFIDLVSRMCAEASLGFIEPSDLGTEFTEGIDFEDCQFLVRAVERGFELLEAKRLRDSQILVDITGGQKVTTFAGAVVCLAEGRKFQYVSTRDFKIRIYDPTYDPEP